MGQLSFFEFIRHQWTTLPPVASFAADLSGKVVVITGANTGLGYEAAKHLARMGPAKLILGCRDTVKGEAAASSIASETGCRTVECWSLDLSKFASVREFAERFEREGGGKLDILIESAGVTFVDWRESEGWELTIKTNHLGTVHLGLRLLPFLLAAEHTPGVPGPRLVVVTSEMHFWTSDIPALETPNVLATLQDKARYDASSKVQGNRYGTSKLLNILFVESLARLLPLSRIPLTVNAVNPGLCHSSIMRNMETPFLRVFKALLARSTEVGSRTLLHAALAKELEGVTGAYLNACHVSEASDLALGEKGEALERKVWEETVKVLVDADPGLREVLAKCGIAQ